MFRFFDNTNDNELETSLLKINEYLFENTQNSMNILKDIILSTENEQEEEAKGLSSLNDRESQKQAMEYFSQKSKKIAIELIIKSIRNKPTLYTSKIEEYINFSIHLTSFNEELSIKGFELVTTIFKVITITEL